MSAKSPAKSSPAKSFKPVANPTMPAPTIAPNPKARRQNRLFWVWLGLLLLGVAALYGGGNRAYGLFDVDEAIFTQATMEMRATEANHGLAALAMPTYNGTPRYHKPPLIYWAQTGALAALGTGFLPGEMGLLAARLPSILGALGSVLLLGLGVWYLTGNRRWGLLAATILALNLSFLVVGRAATADGLLNFFSLALTLWVLALLLPRPLPPAATMGNLAMATRLRHAARALALQRWGWLGTGVLGTLAFLAKGPIAWFPAAIVAGALLLARPNRAATWRTLAPFKVALVVALGLTPWLALLVQQHGVGFFYEFFWVHNLQRFGGDLGNSQSNFVGYYLVVLLVGFFPWVALLPPAIWALLARQKRPQLVARLASPHAAEALPLIALVWAVVYLAFFSLSGTKLAHYIVPAYPALAIIVGGWLASFKTQASPPLGSVAGSVGWLLWGLLLAAVLGVLTPLLLGLQGPALHGLPAMLQPWLGFDWPLRDTLATAILQQPVALGYGFYAAAVGMALGTVLVVAVRRGQRRWLPALAAVWAATLAALAWGVVPVVWRYTQAPLVQVASVLQQLPPSSVVVHHGLHKPSLRLLSGKPFTKTDNPVQIPPLLQTVPELWVVTEAQDAPPLLQELQTSRAGTVLDAKCVAGTCLILLAPLPAMP
jgi:4-amino-4-deoxy-L-arabinose transferase-like glycosyltransferase